MSKQASEIRSKFDVAYAKEQKEKYIEAAEGYKNCIQDKKFFLAYVTLAKLYLEKKVKPHDRECVAKEYIEEAIKLLLTAINSKKIAKKDTDFYKNKIGLPLKRLIDKATFEDDQKERVYFAFAKLEYLSFGGLYKPDTLYYLFESAKNGYAAALKEIDSSWVDIQKTHLASDANALAHSEVSKLFPAVHQSYNSNHLLFCLVIIKKFIESKIVTSSFNSKSLFDSPSKKSWLENVKKFQRELDGGLLFDCYSLALEKDNNVELIFESLNYLNNLSNVANIADSSLSKILQYAKSADELSEEKVLILAVFLTRNKQYEHAYDVFRNLNKEERAKGEASRYYSEVLKALNKEEELNEPVSNQENYPALNDSISNLKTLHELAKKSNQLSPEFTSSLETVVNYAKNGQKEAYDLIAKLSNEKDALPELNQAYYVVQVDKVDKLTLNPTEKSRKSLKSLRTEVEGYAKEARKRYDHYLKEGKQDDIHFRIGMLRYRGIIFEQNYAAARQLFKIAVSKNIRQARYWYAKMCFYGQGGPVDIMEAYQTIRVCTELSADESYLLSEFCYLKYLEAKDAQQQAQVTSFLGQCIEHLLRAIESHHREAMLSLYVLYYYDKEALAADHFARVKNLPAFKQLGINLQSVDNPRDDRKKIDEEQFQAAKLELDFAGNPKALLGLHASSCKDKAVAVLIDFYKLKNKNIILQLITKICYEYNRHKEDSSEYQFLHAIITGLDSTFTNYRPKEFVDYLEKTEREQGKYFDDEVSDDSDDENEIKYQEQPKQTTADFTIANSMIGPIQNSFKEKIEYLLQAKEQVITKKYDEAVEKIKSLFPEVIASSYKPVSQAEIVEQDLQALNHYSAQGKLAEALPLISTRFCVAELRGLHFKTTQWNQPQRREYRKLVKDSNHTLLDRPVYSAAVYDRAGIKELFGHNEVADFRLRKIAKYIHYLMMKMAIQAPYQKGDSTILPDSLFTFSFECRGYQIQQLYSNEYDIFHRFIADEASSSKQEKYFVSRHNPLVSGGAIYSTHTNRYAYGNKPYAGHEHERLRPKYQKDGKCLRPYSGATLLTMHPIDDFARNDHHHVVSLNLNGKLLIDERIVPEHECSFFSFIEADRLKYIHIAKFPSFNHPKYLKIFFHKYGITEQLYDLFKKLLAVTNPHESRRRLAILLLGEYLCAFQTMYLMHHARNRAVKDKLVLVFRDKYGNFSLKPSTDVSPSPNGDQDNKRLRRVHTFLSRSYVTNDEGEESPSEQEEQSDSVLDAKRRKKSSDSIQAEQLSSSSANATNATQNFLKSHVSTLGKMSDTTMPTATKRSLPPSDEEDGDLESKKSRSENEESHSSPSSP